MNSRCNPPHFQWAQQSATDSRIVNCELWIVNEQPRSKIHHQISAIRYQISDFGYRRNKNVQGCLNHARC